MNDNELTEAEVAWLDSLRDGSGPTGTVDPHDIRELVRLAQRGRKVVSAEELAEREQHHAEYIADALTKLADYYRVPRKRKNIDRAKDLAPTVKMLVREFINGWAL